MGIKGESEYEMQTLIRGKIEELVPSFTGFVNSDGVLVLQEDSSLSLTVDTGFSGGIALPEDILKGMSVVLIDYEIFRLATGDEVELPVYWGRVIVKGDEIEMWFIPGDMLLGMEFLSTTGTQLSFDFNKEEVKLLK
jgi:predicted aspartyl protease